MIYKTPCLLHCLYFNFMQLAGSSRVNFALEKDQFIVGYLTNSTLKDGVFSQLISGAGWLVRKYGKFMLSSLMCTIDTMMYLLF